MFVIADFAVAESYHNLMKKVLGIEINLYKWLFYKHTFEFAKRLVTLYLPTWDIILVQCLLK